MLPLTHLIRMASPDVVFALIGDVRRNSRALKQLRALAELNLRVDAFSLGPPASDPWLGEHIRLRVLPEPPGAGPRFFYRLHRQLQEAVRDLAAHVYHASDLYTLPAMHGAARQHGGRLVYDARELYPHVTTTAGRPHVSWFWKHLEGRHIHAADAVFTVSRSIAEHMAATHGIDEPLLLPNVPPRQSVARTDALRCLLAETGPPAPDDHVLVLHQGQIRLDRGCTLLVDAMRDVRGATLVFLGGGALRPRLEGEARAAGLPVRFLDPVPPDALLPVTASADLGVTLLEDTCLNHRFALPNKLFEYLMAGLPVLASDLPEIRRVVAGYDVGRLVNPADRAALTGTLQQMIDDAEGRRRWAANAPRVLETFNWEAASKRLKQVYLALTGTPA